VAHLRSALLLAALLGAAARADDAAAPRPIVIAVDARVPSSNLFRATLEIPVSPGPLRLYYPRWEPTAHGESDGIQRISQVAMSAGAHPVAWRREERDPRTFLCDVPEGADTLTVTLAAAVDFEQDDWNWQSGSTGSVALLSWQDLLLYPAGKGIDQIRVRSSLRIPEGWKLATSLEADGDGKDGVARFKEVSLRELTDSPGAFGRFVRTVPPPLAAGAAPHAIALVSEREMDVSETLLEGITAAAGEAKRMLGPPPMDRYTFLVVTGEAIHGGGREHLRSSVIFTEPGDLEEEQPWVVETLVHEYLHAWNGKRHLPAGMLVQDLQETPDFRLLWVYEGLTTYVSHVVATRSGAWTHASLRWALANEAATVSRQALASGWRSLEDVCVTAPVHSHEQPWQDRRREQAHYGEASLIWLEIDCLLRSRTEGRVSLDDFCHAFFSRTADGPIVTYDWDTIVKLLSSLLDIDWNDYLGARVRATGTRDRTAGLHASGWDLGYVPLVPPTIELSDIEYMRGCSKCADYSTSIGAVVASDGTIVDVTPGSPIEAARIGPGTRIVKVNGVRFDAKAMFDGVCGTTTTRVDLMLERGGETRQVQLEYDGGYRVPDLRRTSGRDLLSKIVESR